MDFSDLIDKDITVHTTGHKHRGVLTDILTSTNSHQGVGHTVLVFTMGVDVFYILADQIIAVTAHGREFGTDD